MSECLDEVKDVPSHFNILVSLVSSFNILQELAVIDGLCSEWDVQNLSVIQPQRVAWCNRKENWWHFKVRLVPGDWILFMTFVVLGEHWTQMFTQHSKSQNVVWGSFCFPAGVRWSVFVVFSGPAVRSKAWKHDAWHESRAGTYL